jgi:hypothetical protein
MAQQILDELRFESLPNLQKNNSREEADQIARWEREIFLLEEEAEEADEEAERLPSLSSLTEIRYARLLSLS